METQQTFHGLLCSGQFERHTEGGQSDGKQHHHIWKLFVCLVRFNTGYKQKPLNNECLADILKMRNIVGVSFEI